MAEDDMYIMRVLNIPHVWLNMADLACLTRTHNILQDTKAAGFLQSGLPHPLLGRLSSSTLQDKGALAHIALHHHLIFSLVSRLPRAPTCLAPGDPLKARNMILS